MEINSLDLKIEGKILDKFLCRIFLKPFFLVKIPPGRFFHKRLFGKWSTTWREENCRQGVEPELDNYEQHKKPLGRSLSPGWRIGGTAPNRFRASQ